MKKIYVLLSFIFLYTGSIAQIIDSTVSDTGLISSPTYALVTVLVNYTYAPNSITDKMLNRYNNTGILPAMNTLPGIRMEERSPNSFRFGIRGSSAQTPFGVRNIKVYYNEIPFTDAGGNTYLNNLGYYNIKDIYVKRGPAGSLFGAGAGGALFIHSMPGEVENTALIHYTAGSYGLQSMAGEFYINDSIGTHAIRYQHSEAQGYRSQSAGKKNVFSYDLILNKGKRNQLKADILYTDLTYQTPGALTLAQYNTNAKDARPATPTIPGAIDNNTTIYQKSFLAGITNSFNISNKWSNKTTLFSSYNQLINPTIRNYSQSYQPNFGGRTTFELITNNNWRRNLHWQTGAEASQQFVTEKTYKNILGTPGALTNDVEINNLLAFAFTNLEWNHNHWSISGGLSYNILSLGIKSFMPVYTKQTKQFDNGIAPRATVRYNVKTAHYIQATVEKGYTPPSTGELSPTGSNINLNLKASQGWNYQLGAMGYFFGKLFYDVNVFNFQLSQAIVQRRDTAGGDYYVNSGGTNQYGIEALFRYNILIRNKNEFFNNIDISLAYTGYDFRYKNFTQLTTNYSNKKLPGVPDHVVSFTTDVKTRIGMYMNLTYYYCSGIFLNDANTDKAVDYTLLGGRIGYKKTIKRVMLDAFVGGDNLLDKKYSLGNDINAAAGRYYNAAPGINFFAGLSFGFKYKKASERKLYNNINEIRD